MALALIQPHAQANHGSSNSPGYADWHWDQDHFFQLLVYWCGWQEIESPAAIALSTGSFEAGACMLWAL
jgi:hypothetical protein